MKAERWQFVKRTQRVKPRDEQLVLDQVRRFAAFLIARRSVFVGVVVGEAALVLGAYFLP